MPSPQLDLADASTTNRPINAGSSLNDNISRTDGVAKVTGAAKYGRDRYIKGALFAGLIRCPWGAAELEGHNLAEVQKLPGVVEASIDEKKLDRKYHGQDVGYVLADSPLNLRRALASFKGRWKRKPVKTRIEDTQNAPPEEAKTTADAPHKLEAVYSTQVQTHTCLETHGCSVDHRGDSATVFASTQGTFAFADGLGGDLGLKSSDFEVKCEFIGGGFGSKLGGAGKQGKLACRLAAKHKRPVYLFESRKDEHLDTGNRPSSRSVVSISIKKDGSIAGGSLKGFGGVGMAGGGGGCTFPSGRYDLGGLDRDHKDVSFNAGMPMPARAPGAPQGAFGEELMMEEIAEIAGIDPLALRIRLAESEMHKEMLAVGGKMIGWEQRQKTGSQTGIMRRGFGIGLGSWHNGGGKVDVECVVFRDGSVEARTGTQDPGTGQRTSMVAIAADGLGIPAHHVHCAIGSTKLPRGPASGGSQTLPASGPMMHAAALDARKQMLDLAAEHLKVKADSLKLSGGVITGSPDERMTWEQVCSLIPGESLSGKASGSDRQSGKTGSADGCQFVDLTIDSETGVVHVNRVVAIQSCGRVICRKTAESQVLGGVIQGISFALFEDRILDRVNGAMVNPNMEWYKILGPKDMPHIEPVLWTKGQTAIRSMGEPPHVPTAGAVACAIYNAIGVPIRSMPMTPDKILAALHSGAAAAPAGASA